MSKNESKRIHKYLRLCRLVQAYVRGNTNSNETDALGLVTVRALAQEFKVSQKVIRDIVEDSENKLDLIVGIRCGNGIGEFERQGDYRVEWIGEDGDGLRDL